MRRSCVVGREGAVGREGVVGREVAVVGRAGGGGQRGAVVGRGSGDGRRGVVVQREAVESNRIEGAKRPFGCKRSEPSCSGSGSAERSAAERDPTNSAQIHALFAIRDTL